MHFLLSEATRDKLQSKDLGIAVQNILKLFRISPKIVERAHYYLIEFVIFNQKVFEKLDFVEAIIKIKYRLSQCRVHPCKGLRVCELFLELSTNGRKVIEFFKRLVCEHDHYQMLSDEACIAEQVALSR